MDCDFLQPNQKPTKLEHESFVKALQEKYSDRIFSYGEKFVMKVDKNVFVVRVEEITTSTLDFLMSEEKEEIKNNSNEISRGLLSKYSTILFKSEKESPLNITNAPNVQGGKGNITIISPTWNFEQMGIGGLDNEFSTIFRRAFASRLFPATEVAKYGIKHVRGMLLFGPPGTGKTLIARKIGQMLNAVVHPPISGPEILNKFVGQSEENIRKLFEAAEREYKERGDESDLHIIIVDEIDAICKQRGSTNSGTGVGDSVVNQLLAKLDGVEELNNILFIAMTNRKELIDDALLRPGRIEVHVEIGLPDEKGRLQILKIHTQTMKDNNKLGNDVNLEQLSIKTKNFSGAEISGLVKSATSWAFNEIVDTNNVNTHNQKEMPMVGQKHFLLALNDTIPSFGMDVSEFENCAPYGVKKYSQKFEEVIDSVKLFIKQLSSSKKTPLLTVLLHGEAGCGKTALSTHLAINSGFPLVKLISPSSMVSFSESQKVDKITRIFNDACKSPSSVVVLDNIERLLEYVPIGPRFSNVILQTLLVLLNKPPPKGRKLLVIATTSSVEMLRHMQLDESFNSMINMPSVTTQEEVQNVLKEIDVFSEKELIEASKKFHGSISIKKLLMVAELASQGGEGSLVDRFASALEKYGCLNYN
eukprot:TRINITY_DN5221_c0_g2_i1.p1 TRINITY_DN5221_c0_g2~~TRINITY_DN5221_c0_g2_i1.p1  ORF type:complete len:750 (+),score=256.46 TRINITY_DN5221_c0_g2_i1:318-2252(+)